MDDAALAALADRLASVTGVVAVVLGGSRARGTHRPDSDYDLGLYYRGGLDVAALRALAAELTREPPDAAIDVTEPGSWGPWVNGGAWLTLGGTRVDWIYRDLDRVHRIWDDCRRGRYELGFQVGHPLGYYSHTYAGEVALCRVLADATGELAALRAETGRYPPALGDALVTGLWEAEFSVRGARYGAAGADPTFAAGCLFRAVGVMCHALHGRARQWLTHEKGMVASAGRLPVAPPGFADRAHAVLAAIGAAPAQIAEAAARAEALITEIAEPRHQSDITAADPARTR
jgi:predicted nucleotidyltransferase